MEALLLILVGGISIGLTYLSIVVLKEYFKMWRNIDKIVTELEYIHNEIEKSNEY